MTPTHETVSLQTGEQLFYYRHRAESGNQDRTPIILLHGLSQQADFWDLCISAIGADNGRTFDILTLDQRGHGASQSFTAGHDLSISALTSDVISLMDHARIPRALLVGHSMGAMVALHCADEFPERVSGVVLIDGGIRMPTDNFPNSLPTREELIAALTPPAGPFSGGDLRRYYGQLDSSNIEAIMGAVQRTYIPVAENAYVSTLGLSRHLEFITSILDHNSRSILERISVPVWALLCHSNAEDMLEDSRSWDYLANQTHIQIQHWYGCVHDVPLQRPAMIASLINFVARSCVD